MNVTRRELLRFSRNAALILIPAGIGGCAGHAANGYQIVHTDAEWSKILTHGQYLVLRQRATEPAFSSPLDHEKREGVFDCAGCDQPAFSSKTKFDSGTGWPSFWKPIQNAVQESSDNSMSMERTEVHCSRCGGHLGHVFDDGPKPTGLRYCINGLALTFKPSA
jgi:peptide-methionine (R)-S-oxide reductase